LCNGAAVLSRKRATREIFEELGLDFDKHLRWTDGIFFRIGDKDHRLTPEGGMAALISAACHDPRETAKILSALKRAMTWDEPSAKMTIGEWIGQYTHNRKILDLWWGMSTAFLGENLEEAPANEFFSALKAGSGEKRELGIPPQGLGPLNEDLADYIKQKKGTIWTGCRAKQILVEDELVKGVMIQKGTEEIEIQARAVISNVGPAGTVRLAGKDHFSVGYLRELREKIRPMPVVSIHSAADRPFTDYQGVLIISGSRKINFTLCPTNLCPEHAPRNKHLLVTFGAPESALLPVDWKKEIELNIQDIKDHFPEFNRSGKILMAQVWRGEWPGMRSWPGYMVSQKTPVELLYNVGDGVVPQGMYGSFGAAASAKIVVEDLAMRIRPG
jgi:phytoene dehydrogenase-like protein